MNKQLLAGLIVPLLLVSSGCATTPAVSQDATAVAAVRAKLTQIQENFNTGDLDAFMPAFADDAMIIGQGSPDVIGKEAIRELYAGAMAATDIKVAFNTEEIEVFGDLAYERGTYSLHISDKSSGTLVGEVENRHVHILRKNAAGEWQTWRMMVNNVDPAPDAAAPEAE